MYKKSWLRLQQKTPQLLSYEDRALYSTWDISYSYVKQQSELAAKPLRLWAYFDNQDVWLELLQECQQDDPVWFSELTKDPLNFDEAVRVLCDHGLAEADAAVSDTHVGSPGYSMHSCVHSWTKDVVNEEWDSDMVKLVVHCVGLHVPDRNGPQHWLVYQRLVQHANRCQEFINAGLAGQVDSGMSLKAIHNLGHLYGSQDQLNKSEEMYRRALDRYENVFGHEHPSTLSAVCNLGAIYADQGKLDKAVEMCRRALNGCGQACGPEHTSIPDTVINLGVLCWKLGWLDEAEKMYQRALQGFERVQGLEHISTLDTANNLGLLYADMGRLDEAEKMYQQALQGNENVRGLEHTLTLSVVNNLGNLYKNLGRLDEAEKMCQRAVQGYEKA
jgi:tetratricopeptide (TPR) repeat protein